MELRPAGFERVAVIFTAVPTEPDLQLPANFYHVPAWAMSAVVVSELKGEIQWLPAQLVYYVGRAGELMVPPGEAFCSPMKMYPDARDAEIQLWPAFRDWFLAPCLYAHSRMNNAGLSRWIPISRGNGKGKIGFLHHAGQAARCLTSENGRLSGVRETRPAKSHPRIPADFSVLFLGEAHKRGRIDCIRSGADFVRSPVMDGGSPTPTVRDGDFPSCAGINRHVVGDARALQERRQRLHPGLESCMGHREVFREA